MDYVALPKIELHAHLTGSISRRTLREVWLRKRELGGTDLEDPAVVMPDDKHDYNLKTFFPLFSSYIYNLVDDEASVRLTTASVLRDFAADGVAYLELRTTPRPAGALSAAEYVAVVASVVAEHNASSSSSSNKDKDNATANSLRAKLILSIDRRHSPATASSVLAIAASHPSVVVGVDLCGDPTARSITSSSSSSLPPSSSDEESISIFAPHFLAARNLGLGITLHFAEAQASSSKAELDELLSWRPDRLGHVIWEDEATRREIVSRSRGGDGGLCLELCLSCNVKAGMVSGGFEGHHFGTWRAVEGVKVALCTDDVGVFGSPLSNEYRLVAQHFNLDEKETRALARQPIDSIFGGEEEKERLRSIMWT